MVVFQHLGGMGVMGGYAVFGFYTLSGYLMTLIMHETYGYSTAGIQKYGMNRFLRIYPIYWLACIISLLLIVWLGNDYSKAFHSRMFIPENSAQILQNIFIVFGQGSRPRLTPPSWALTVELFYYACIALGASKTKKTTLIWFAISTVYAIVINVAGFEWPYKYFIIPAASLPFSVGGLIYHFKDKILERLNILKSGKAPFILIIMVLGNYIVNHVFHTLRYWGFYNNFLLNCLLVMSLMERKSLLGISKSLDKRIGDLSYPIYLVHYQCGLFLSTLVLNIKRGTPLFAFVCLPLIVIVSWAMSKLVEMPIEGVRKKIKADQKASASRNAAP